MQRRGVDERVVARQLKSAKVQRKLPAQFAEREAEFAEKACTLTAFGLRKALVAFVNEHKPGKAVEFDGELGVELVLRNDGRYDMRGVLDTISGQVLERALQNEKDLAWRAANPERNPERVEQPNLSFETARTRM